ncbi:helix-turn-helix transcriptional regulator [Paenibacillus radicis (ex Gao et al. 2016)]|uniref:AraC family transcriptional regulator n=1 Tax=Paenibacillus radicis (ex Gao et al. 2016) TaxID=1737354 RepID=A0A917GQS4_9BACL|nr:AraC family transcriptional regulator [Paenibacillus radicis (ex Gao et al. 2016)]GGG54562.1 AraC family transcriptional regulator [Paenibacillus radicis (ex Gao et al. 2016)]
MKEQHMHAWHEKITRKTNSPLNIIISPVEFGTGAHWHKEMEIVYIMEGSMEIGLHHERIAMQPRDLLFIGSCDVHQFFASPQGCKKIILQLEKSIFENCADEVFTKRFDTPHLNSENPLMAEGLQTLHSLFERNALDIYEEWENRRHGCDLAIKARVNDMLTGIVRHMPMSPYSPEETIKRLEKQRRLEDVLKYIEQHYESDITLTSAADVSGYSVHYFSRFFKEATDKNFVDYVNEFRITEAMQQLKDGDASVTDIAFKVGFNSIETFNRVFKKLNGCTPTVYRSKI